LSLFERLFGSKRTDSTRLEHIESKVRVLDDILEKQGRSLKALELEWEQTYDKLAHLMARITKRRAALEREQQQAELPQAPETTNAPPMRGGPSYGTHDDLQEMRRRNGLLPR